MGRSSANAAALGRHDCSRCVSPGVLHLDHGVWRFVNGHFSQGTANEETFGRTLTTTVEQLAAAVHVEQPDMTGTMADDGTVTIAFSDIEGSTDLAVRLGDQTMVRSLAMA